MNEFALGPNPLSGASVIDDAVEHNDFTRFSRASHPSRFDGEAAGGVSTVAESTLRLGGLHCAACAGTIEQALDAVPGVLDARVDASSNVATVRWDPRQTQPSALVAAIEAAGYEAAPDTAAAARALRTREARLALWRLTVAVGCAMQVMMLAAPAYFAAPGDLAPDHKRLLDWGGWLLTLPVLWFSAAPFFRGAWQAATSRRIGMDVPVALGITVAFLASTGAAFDPAGPFGNDVYFDSVTMFIAFLLGGRWFEMQARHRAEARLEDATLRLPDSVVRLLTDGRTEVVSTKRLRVGDYVRIPVGQAFAADGVITDGATDADEALLNGESQPVRKVCGASVIAGSLNLRAPIVMRVERVGADTRFEAIVALMRAARTQRPNSLAHVDRWAGPFLWGVLVLAASAGLAWSVIDPSRAVWVVVSVLIVTCPCALSLASPSSLTAAAGAMGRRGLLLRRLDAIEGLARMQTLFVDKTGTLTDGAMRCVAVTRLVRCDDAAPTDDLLAAAASLATWSSHPLATALQMHSHASTASPSPSNAPRDMAWRDASEVAGQGVEAVAGDGGCWRLGSVAWVGGSQAGSAHADDGANARTWLGLNGRPLLCLSFDERVRAEARTAVRALQADGVRVVLLSGDAPTRVRRMACTLDLDGATGAMSPEQKLATVRAAQSRGEVVAMLGDGINDAPVLAQADVSIAMGEGAQVARAQADGVLISNSLDDVVRARALAKRTLRVMRQNLAWAAAYNVACVPLALVGALPPWAAGLGMASSSLLVILNASRLSR